MHRIARLISTGIILGLGFIPVAEAASVLDGGAPVNRRDNVAVARRIVPLAQRGDAHAQAILGFMFATGQGVPQSYEAAVEWYSRSADGGDPMGQYRLGLMYDKGFGVSKNIVLAYKWLNLAAAHASRRDREHYALLRDAVATKMTRDQFEEGQQLALEFVPKRR
jgi:TPR repeat protein